MNRAAPDPKANMGKPEPRLDGAAEGDRRSALRLRFSGQQSGLRFSGHQPDRQGHASPASIWATAQGGARRAGHLHAREHRRLSK